MPVETGRWRRIARDERLCTACNTIGDEQHYIYTCPEIDRSNLDDIPELHELQDFSKLSTLIERLENYLWHMIGARSCLYIYIYIYISSSKSHQIRL